MKYIGAGFKYYNGFLLVTLMILCQQAKKCILYLMAFCHTLMCVTCHI